MKLILAGRGKMAQTLHALCARENLTCLPFEDNCDMAETEDLIAVHFGSGRQLDALIRWCENHHVPLIQGASNRDLPQNVRCPIIDAPNLALPIIKFLGVLPMLAGAMQGMEAMFVESHQASKTSAPATATAMARIFGIPETDIVSVRNPALQLQLGVPEAHLSGHARLWLALKGEGIKISITTEVNGRDVYAYGTIALAKALHAHRQLLENRIYHLVEVQNWV